MNLPARIVASDSQPSAAGAELWHGFLFVRRHTTLRVLIMLVAVISFCGMSFGTLLPIFARDVFHRDSGGYTLLLTCNGLGALVAAGSLAFTRSVRHKGKRVLLGAFGFSLGTLAFSLAPQFWLACAALLFSGFFLLSFLMAANTLIRTLSPDTLPRPCFCHLFDGADWDDSHWGYSIRISCPFLGSARGGSNWHQCCRHIYVVGFLEISGLVEGRLGEISWGRPALEVISQAILKAVPCVSVSLWFKNCPNKC